MLVRTFCYVKLLMSDTAISRITKPKPTYPKQICAMIAYTILLILEILE